MDLVEVGEGVEAVVRKTVLIPCMLSNNIYH